MYRHLLNKQTKYADVELKESDVLFRLSDFIVIGLLIDNANDVFDSAWNLSLIIYLQSYTFFDRDTCRSDLLLHCLVEFIEEVVAGC